MKKKERIYVCHTFYHVYITALKELNRKKEDRGKATLVLSTMSNDFGGLKERAEASGLFEAVHWYEEKEDKRFPELEKLHTDKGNIVLNMLNRIRYTKLLGKFQEPYIPVDFREYREVFVFCDSDPIGYYLSYKKIAYHALEDGLDCLSNYDTARYSNRGHFGLKAWMAAHNLIFMENGYGKYCLDMEVNDLSCLPFPIPKHKEKPRSELTKGLGEEDKRSLVSLFMPDLEGLERQLSLCPQAAPKILVLTEPLCSLEVRERLFRDVIREYGQGGTALIKPHPRDVLDYREKFPGQIILEGKFPMEILNFIPGLWFDRVVSVFTVPHAIRFAKEVVYLGRDFMDKYEAPELHRRNEQIGG